MKMEWFGRFGWMLLFVWFFYSYALMKQYGKALPHSVEEWMGEAFAGFLLVSGLAFVAVGRHLNIKAGLAGGHDSGRGR